ncbi:glycosyltransferase family 2 protein [Streptomyces sp. NPDC057011]|uniref:glycosyltransferase family 2 protein n=1 Tax=unclassified Streptomyces TaxID=2593676 RepID=UPI00363C3C08
MSGPPRLGVAVITMGTRPAELLALLDSVRAQHGEPVRIVVVGNGCRLEEGGLGPGVETVELPENLGVSGGRNVAWETLRAHGDVDVVVDLDDDGLLPDPDTFALLRKALTDPAVGIVSFRIADETGFTQRRHVPRLRAADPMAAGEVTTFLGGGHAIRAEVFEQVGGWPTEFFFGHEETDLAWRAIDAGWQVRYEPRLLLQHPRTSPARHAVYFRTNARNRVWLAKRHLPAPLVPVYLGVWTVLTLVRRPPLEGLKAWLGGFAEGVRTPCGPRKPMRWRTVARMARLGRPPVI